MTEPRTAAGRELLAELSENPLAGARYAHHVVSLRLPAIEAEAAALGAAESDERIAGLLRKALDAIEAEAEAERA
jgi:hypothetical protein